MSRAWLTVAVTTAQTVATVAAAVAAPVVAVHARTEIRLRPIRKDYGGVYVVSGTLVDRFSGQPLSGEEVTLRFAGRSVTARTDVDGTFEVRVRAPGGRQDLAVEYAGSDLLEPSTTTLDDVDVDKNAVDLSIDTAAQPGGVRIGVSATAAGTTLRLPVQLQVGPADTPDQLRVVATLTSGGPPFVLTRAAAGGPGTRRVRAVFAGDSLYNRAAADATIELDTQTTTTLALRSASVAYEDDVVATGRVVDEDGEGVARAAIALLDGDDQRIAQATTGADGSFRFKLGAKRLGAGEDQLQAVLEPTAAWMRGSRSPILDVRVAQPQPVPIAYTLAAFALTALAAGGFFAARSRPWARLRRAPAVPDRERAPGDAPAEPTGGLVPARPSLVSTLRRPGDHGIGGLVRDAVRRRPLPGARVTLTLAGQSIEAVAGADGAFTIEGLAAGEWHVVAAHAGHVTERFAVTLPHRGELRGARVDLMPVRERIFSMYRRAALPLLPDPAQWGVWSPRQLFEHVRRRSTTAPGAPALAALTDYVEAAYFSARLPDEDALPVAADRVERALREQASVV